MLWQYKMYVFVMPIKLSESEREIVNERKIDAHLQLCSGVFLRNTVASVTRCSKALLIQHTSQTQIY